MYFLYKPLKAMDDPIWSWPSAIPKHWNASPTWLIYQARITLQHIQRFHSKQQLCIFCCWVFLVMRLFFSSFLGFLFFSHSITCLYSAKQSVQQKYHCHKRICFNRSQSRFPNSLLAQRQQPCGWCCVGLRTWTTSSWYFSITRGIVDNYHAWT